MKIYLFLKPVYFIIFHDDFYMLTFLSIRTSKHKAFSVCSDYKMIFDMPLTQWWARCLGLVLPNVVWGLLLWVGPHPQQTWRAVEPARGSIQPRADTFPFVHPAGAAHAGRQVLLLWTCFGPGGKPECFQTALRTNCYCTISWIICFIVIQNAFLPWEVRFCTCPSCCCLRLCHLTRCIS